MTRIIFFRSFLYARRVFTLHFRRSRVHSQDTAKTQTKEDNPLLKRRVFPLVLVLVAGIAGIVAAQSLWEGQTGGSKQLAVPSNTIELTPMQPGSAAGYSVSTMNVALGSGVSGNVSVAIYADASGQPGQTTVPAGAPICSGGPVAATSGTVSTTLSNCQLTGGLTYWLAKNSDTASGTETVQNWYCNQGSPTSVSEHVSWTFGTWPGELPSPVPYSQQCNAMYAVVSPLSTAPAATATALGLRLQDAYGNHVDIMPGTATFQLSGLSVMSNGTITQLPAIPITISIPQPSN